MLMTLGGIQSLDRIGERMPFFLNFPVTDIYSADQVDPF